MIETVVTLFGMVCGAAIVLLLNGRRLKAERDERAREAIRPMEERVARWLKERQGERREQGEPE